MVAQNILNDVMALSPTDRLELVHRLWDSLMDDPTAPPLSPEQQQELGRRYDEFVQDPLEGSSWEEAETFVRARLGSWAGR